MNLSETDKELIADIVEQKLRHYKLISEPAVDVVEPENTKPPLGIMPRNIWLQKRLFELEKAIDRYTDAAKTVPQEWFYERMALLNELNTEPIKEVEKELSEPKQEESTKWNVIVEPFEHNKKDHKIVIAYTDHHILTEELAQSAATKIREILLGV